MITLVLVWFAVGLAFFLPCLLINEGSSASPIMLFFRPIKLSLDALALFFFAWMLWPIYVGFTLEWFWFGGRQKFNLKLREQMAAKRRDV